VDLVYLDAEDTRWHNMRHLGKTSDVSNWSTAPRLGIVASHITTAVASKLPRNQRLSQKRAILIGRSNEETDHERKRINPVQQSTAA
jgi:hypothetical protein